MTDEPKQEILQGDCIEEMRSMDADSVHAVVTDPPYNFDGGIIHEGWDEIGTPAEYQDWCEQWASQCLRILKPGGHLIAFSSTKSYGRLMCGVQDAGFEIRDQIDWIYAQGVPKGSAPARWMDGEDAEEWSGWESGLNPAHEPAVLARKPLSEAAIYKNVLVHGTGALNIDETRVEIADEDTDGFSGSDSGRGMVSFEGGVLSHSGRTPHEKGRYPSNLCLGSAVGDLDKDLDAASRFFFTSKASPSERTINDQVENNHKTVKPLGLMEWLVTLVTAEGQRVLDPFAGSGTTIMACRRLDRDGVGVELDEGFAELARKRVELAHELDTDFEGRPPAEPGDNVQPGLDTFSEGVGE